MSPAIVKIDYNRNNAHSDSGPYALNTLHNVYFTQQQYMMGPYNLTFDNYLKINLTGIRLSFALVLNRGIFKAINKKGGGNENRNMK